MIRYLAIALIATALLGCASTPDENYGRYLDAQASQVEAAREQKPLVDLTFDSEGRLIGLAVNQPYQPVNIQPHRPSYHPIWGVIRTAIPVAGSVWGMYAAGDAFADVLSAGGGSQSSTINITGDGSGNTAGRDIPVTFDASSSETVRTDIRTDMQRTDIRNDNDTTTDTDTRYDNDTTTTTTTETTDTRYDNDTTTTTTTETVDTVDDHSQYSEIPQ